MWDMKRPYRFDLLFSQASMLASRTTFPADITKGSRRAAVLTKRAAVTSLSAHVISAPPACLEGELSVTRKWVCASQPYVASIMSQNIGASITSPNIDVSITSSTNWCRVWLEDFFLRCILQSSLFLFSHLFIRVFGAQRNIHGTEVRTGTLTT